jgi:hypothetical protein
MAIDPHICNLSYSGDKDRRILTQLRPAWAKLVQDPL